MEDEIYKIVDDYLQHLSLQKTGGSIMSIDRYSTVGENAIRLMKVYDLISFRSSDESSSIVDIRPLGLEILNNGGIKKYLDRLNKNKAERELLERKKLKYEVKNAERIFKTYWWTFAIAMASFGISAYLLIDHLINKR